MRLVSALLFVALTGSVTLADEAKPADPKPEVTKSKVPLRVVRMLPETHQVLLHDRIRGTHVVAEVGQEIDGFIVDEIAEDEVTLVAPSGAEVILTAPDMTWRRRAAERKAAASKAGATAAPAVVTGPVATPGSSPTAPGTGEAAPQDPYADIASAEPIRVASADGTPAGATPAPAPATVVAPNPADSYEPGITAFADAVGADPAPSATVTASPAIPAPAAAAPIDRTTDAAGTLAAAATGMPAPLPSATAANSFTVPRADVDAALADFGATAVTFDARFVADGLRLDSIAEGTLLAKAGLKKGDTITAIDGKPLRSFDDAADLYARMPKARSATIAVVRGGKPLTLKVAIR